MSAARTNVPVRSPMYVAGDGKTADGGSMSLVWAQFFQGLGDGIPAPFFETPGGVIDNTNKVFTLSRVPVGGVVLLMLDNALEHPGVDFTLATATITYAVAPQVNDTHVAFYFTAAAPNG
jgi:hypothetical protein